MLRFTPLGTLLPPEPHCVLVGTSAPQTPCPGREAFMRPRCAHAHMALVAREHDARLSRSMTSNHIDMQYKYCGHCYDIHIIHIQYIPIHSYIQIQSPVYVQIMHKFFRCSYTTIKESCTSHIFVSASNCIFCDLAHPWETCATVCGTGDNDMLDFVVIFAVHLICFLQSKIS